MKKTIAPIINHCSENDSQEKHHKYCPSKSWYKFKTDIENGSNQYISVVNILSAI